MSVKKTVLILLTVLVVLVAAYTLITLKKIYTPTSGERIAEYAKSHKALLVIDVQEDFTGLNGKQPVPLPDSEKQIAAINRLVKYAVKSGMEVVYIRQLYDNNLITRNFIGRAIQGFPGSELDARVMLVNRNVFPKKISDAFSNPILNRHLVTYQVDELYLTGLDAAYCVYYTALGALNRGYKVTAVSDAMMTAKNMAEIIDLYRKKGITVTTSEAIMN